MNRENRARAFKEHNLEETPAKPFCALVNGPSGRGLMSAEHWHDYAELLYVYEGIAKQTLNQTEFIFLEGELLLIAGGDVHGTVALQEGCRIAVIQFLQGSAQPASQHFTKPYPGDSKMRGLFENIVQEFHQKEYGYENIIQGCILEILGYVQRGGSPASSWGRPRGQRIIAVSQYIRDHVRDPLTLEEVARAAGYSPTYLSKFFKREMGVAFKQYVDTVKILEAKRLILLEEYTISQAARELSYDDASSFSRAFKRIEGYSPSLLLTRSKEEKDSLDARHI